MEINEAIEEALAVDLSEAEASLWESLPDAPARTAMVSETSLEYRRWWVLRRLGLQMEPSSESLLRRFIGFAPKVKSVGSLTEGVSYDKIFGHKPTYPWRAAINLLCYGGPQPSTGGDHQEL